jgi:peptide chain release factor 1
MVLPEAEEFDANRYEWLGWFFLFFRTRWTIGKYNKISPFNSHSNRISGSMIKNHNIKIKTRHSAFCSRLYEQELAKKTAEDATKRTSQVSSGDRSNKIRTYLCTRSCNGSQSRFDALRSRKYHEWWYSKIVDELALVNNMEKLKEASEVFKKYSLIYWGFFLEQSPCLEDWIFLFFQKKKTVFQYRG